MRQKTIFAVASAIIFVSVVFVPLISANTKNDIRLQEISVEIHTLKGVKTISKELSIDAIEKLSFLMNKTQKSLENIDDLLLELKNQGLLGDFSIREAKKIITTIFRERLFESKIFPVPVNALCLIIGYGTNATRLTSECLGYEYLAVVFAKFPLLYPLSILCFAAYMISALRPKLVAPFVGLFSHETVRVSTIGALGLKSEIRTWSRRSPVPVGFFIAGFTGLWIVVPSPSSFTFNWFIGSAIAVF